MRGIRLAFLGTAFTALVALPACGGTSSGDDAGDDGDDTAAPDSGVPSDFTELIGRDWDVPAGGTDTYRCVRVRVDHDMYVNAFHVEAPTGTHHTVLTISSSSTPLGDYNCDAGSLDFQMLFASGVGTDDLEFPTGVGMHLTAGQYINLNLHLFNVDTTNAITGHTAVWVREIPQAEVTDEAEMVFAGTANINVPPNTTDDQNPYTTHGGCTFNNPATLLAYWPHMHQHAIHQSVTLTLGGTPTVVHDDDYTFNEQKNYPLDAAHGLAPISIASGDSIDVVCSYLNDSTTDTITFGESSLDEMCFTGLYRYPKQALYLFECTTGLGPGGF
jgi:hypothetical protein